MVVCFLGFLADILLGLIKAHRTPQAGILMDSEDQCTKILLHILHVSLTKGRNSLLGVISRKPLIPELIITSLIYSGHDCILCFYQDGLKPVAYDSAVPSLADVTEDAAIPEMSYSELKALITMEAVHAVLKDQNLNSINMNQTFALLETKLELPDGRLSIGVEVRRLVLRYMRHWHADDSEGDSATEKRAKMEKEERRRRNGKKNGKRSEATIVDRAIIVDRGNYRSEATRSDRHNSRPGNSNGLFSSEKFFSKYKWGRGDSLPQTQPERVELLKQQQRLQKAMKNLKKRGAVDDPRRKEGDQLVVAYQAKATTIAGTVGLHAQKVDHACAQMEGGSESVHTKLKQMQACMSKMRILTGEVEGSHNFAVLAGGAAADVALKLLAAGAPDTVPAEAPQEVENVDAAAHGE